MYENQKCLTIGSLFFYSTHHIIYTYHHTQCRINVYISTLVRNYVKFGGRVEYMAVSSILCYASYVSKIFSKYFFFVSKKFMNILKILLFAMVININNIFLLTKIIASPWKNPFQIFYCFCYILCMYIDAKPYICMVFIELFSYLPPIELFSHKKSTTVFLV